MDTAAPDASLLCRLIAWTPPRWVLLVLLCGVLIVRHNYVHSHADQLLVDPDGYREVATNLYEDHAFSREAPFPFSGNAPTAARPPLFPLVLALGYLVDVDPGWPCGILHVILGTLTVWGTWHLGRLWNLPSGACLLAAGMVAIDPILLAYSSQLMTETLATFLAVMALVALTKLARQTSLAWALAAGVLLGLAILCRPIFLFWFLPVAALFPWLAAGKHRALRLVVLVAATVATVAPWGVRNFRIFGQPVVTTTHGGFTLLLANNPSFYQYLREAPWATTWDGIAVNRQWKNAFVPLPINAPNTRIIPDEVANDRWAYREAFENIRAEPGMFIYSCFARNGRLWNVLPHQTTADESPSTRGMRWAVAIFYTFEFVLAAIGAWFLRGKLLAHPWVWGALLVLSVTVVHAFYWTDMRMRAPLVPVVALAAASGLALLACPKAAASASEPAL